jgi:two-component system, chemotaxis family, chemotaxis protein CheY
MSYNILIVDDSMTARLFISKALQLSGADIGHTFQAINGLEALEILRKEWIDLVFADINMPEMNGIEMVKNMRDDGLMKTLPVAVISTERSETRIEELKASGVRVFLNKPVTPEMLKRVVDTLLSPDISPERLKELGQ